MRSPVAAMLTAVAVVCTCGGAKAAAGTEVPFHRGVNLTSWLQVGSARQIQFTRFTKQGASWTSPSMVPLAGVPFPYGAGPMPACPPELKGTWVESSLNAYSRDGTVKRVKELIDIAVRFRDESEVPIFCGELGVYRLNSDNDQRAYW